MPPCRYRHRRNLARREKGSGKGVGATLSQEVKSGLCLVPSYRLRRPSARKTPEMKRSRGVRDPDFSIFKSNQIQSRSTVFLLDFPKFYF